MTEYQGKFTHYRNGKAYAAIVKIIAKESVVPNIKISCNGDGWVGQGSLEYVSKVGYESWKQGAVIGTKYALEKAGKSNLSVEITEIVGMITDTSPAAVGAATIYAVWKAIDYVPTEIEKTYIEKIVFSSDFEELPNF